MRHGAPRLHLGLALVRTGGLIPIDVMTRTITSM